MTMDSRCDIIRGEIVGADFEPGDHVMIHVKVPAGTAVGHWFVVIMDAADHEASLPTFDDVRGILGSSEADTSTASDRMDIKPYPKHLTSEDE